MSTAIKLFHWLPRVISMLAIFFVSLFSINAFAPGLTLDQQLAGFLIHLIPSSVLLLLLLMAWKWEYMGGMTFLIIGLSLTPFIFLNNYNMNHSISQSLVIILKVTIPLMVIGILFILSHFLKIKNPR